MEREAEAELCFPTFNNSCRKISHSNLETIIIYIVLSAITVLTIILNLLVIISISHFRQLHTATNFLLLSLAVSDFLIGSLQMPFQIFYYRGCWLLGDILCVMYVLGGFIGVGTSSGTMVLISVDRYMAICDPMLYQTKVTLRRVQGCICFCWVNAIIYVCCILKDSIKQPGFYSTCLGQCTFLINPLEAIVDTVISFVVPFTAITVLYLRVFLVAVSQARAMRSRIIFATLQQSRAMAKKSELKAAKTLGVLVIVYLILTLPYFVHTFTLEDSQMDPSSGNVQVWLLYFNSCINPIIYAFSYPWFRRSVKRIVTLQILQLDSRDSKIL